MRKLLLATVAGLGVWGAAASDAGAQVVPGTVSSYSGGVAYPAMAAPSPGSVVVRLNGRLRFYAFGVWDRDVDNNATGGTLSPTTGLGTATGGYKQANYGIAEFGRLYPGFDGVAANGLKYGANLEIRMDQNSPAGGGAFGSISGQNRARSALYFRRVWGYIGTDQIGTFRLGAVDGPTALFETGTFENFNDGGLNGDLPALQSGPVQVTWPFSVVGNLYTTNKLVYLSPSFFGFDMGASFEPSTANTSGQNNGCGAGTWIGANFSNPAGNFTAASGTNSSGASTIGCDRLSSSPSNAESQRRRNTFEAILRYRGSFGPVGIAATAGYIGGGHVLDNGATATSPFNNNPLAAGGARRRYEGLSVGDFGAQLTAFGFSFGGHYMRGRYNGQWGATAEGFKDSEAGLVGASYTMGPLIVGAHYLSYSSPGDLANAYYGRTRRETGIGAGGTYNVAPGLSLFLSYLWGQRKQNGFNFVDGSGVSAATGTAGNPFHNKTTSSILALGTAFSW